MASMNRIFSIARQAKRAIGTHQGSIERGIDKAGNLANQKTGAKHDDRIRKGTDHLRTGLGKITGNPSNRSDDDRPLSEEPHIDGETPDQKDNQ